MSTLICTCCKSYNQGAISISPASTSPSLLSAWSCTSIWLLGNTKRMLGAFGIGSTEPYSVVIYDDVTSHAFCYPNVLILFSYLCSFFFLIVQIQSEWVKGELQNSIHMVCRDLVSYSGTLEQSKHFLIWTQVSLLTTQPFEVNEVFLQKLWII